MKKLVAVSGVLFTALLAGCANQCVQMPYNTDDFSKNVKTSNGVLTVTSPGSDLTSGNLLEGKVVIVNDTDKAQSAKYQFQWLDARGFPAATNNPWQPVVIAPRSSQVVSDVAPSPSMNRYVIRVCK